jgi:hypothetical protein
LADATPPQLPDNDEKPSTSNASACDMDAAARKKKVRDEALALAIEQPARAVPEPASGKARSVVLAAAETQGDIAAAEGASDIQLQDAGETDGKNK